MRTEPEVAIPMKLKRLRVKAGLTQQGLAKETGLTQASISRIENALAIDISISTADALAQAFDITIDELIQ